MNVLLSTTVLLSLVTAYRGVEEKLLAAEEEALDVREAGLRGRTWSV